MNLSRLESAEPIETKMLVECRFGIIWDGFLLGCSRYSGFHGKGLTDRSNKGQLRIVKKSGHEIILNALDW